jgi:hypothetical protein
MTEKAAMGSWEAAIDDGLAWWKGASSASATTVGCLYGLGIVDMALQRQQDARTLVCSCRGRD